MAVLIEAISVVVRQEAIESQLRGGWPAFLTLVPNRTLCTDGEIARVGFMVPADVKAFIDRLTSVGLTFVEAEGPRDLVVVDQRTGPTADCDWIIFENLSVEGGGRVASCRLRNSCRGLATPEGWTFERSLSRDHAFVPSAKIEDQLDFIGRENGMDVYRERSTGRQVYIGRTAGSDANSLAEWQRKGGAIGPFSAEPPNAGDR